MKCPRCKGKGKYKTIFGDMVTCDFCWGTGEHEPFDVDVALDEIDGGITNEEYIRTAPFEELVDVFYDVWANGFPNQKSFKRSDVKKRIREWLYRHQFHQGQYLHQKVRVLLFPNINRK